MRLRKPSQTPFAFAICGLVAVGLLSFGSVYRVVATTASASQYGAGHVHEADVHIDEAEWEDIRDEAVAVSHSHRHRHAPGEPEHEHSHSHPVTSVTSAGIDVVGFTVTDLLPPDSEATLYICGERVLTSTRLSSIFRPPISSARS